MLHSRQQKDFSVRELREFNKGVMQQIGEATQVHPDLAEAVTMYFQQVSHLPLLHNHYCLLLLLFEVFEILP